MLYLDCKVGDQILIEGEDSILIEINQIRYADARFLIEAPYFIKIFRKEVLDRMRWEVDRDQP